MGWFPAFAVMTKKWSTKVERHELSPRRSLPRTGMRGGDDKKKGGG